MGNYAKALQLYENIHEEYPENSECLRYLVAICKDLGRPYERYQQKLVKLDRALASQAKHGGGGASGNGGGAMTNAMHNNSNSSKSDSKDSGGSRMESKAERNSPKKRDKLEAPSAKGVARGGGGGGAREEEDFADDDVSDLLV